MMRWTKSKAPEASETPVKQAAARTTAPPRSAAPAAPAAKQTKSLPQLLLEQGKVSREQLEEALKKQKETGAFLGEILVDEKIIDESSFLSFLAKFCKIPHLSLLDYLIDKDIIGLIPKEICLKYRVLPIDKMGSNLTVAMVNPLNTEALKRVREASPGLRIKPILCAFNHFEMVCHKVFDEGAVENAPSEMSLKSLGFAVPKTDTVPEPKSEPSPPEPVAPAPAAPEPAPEPVAPESAQEPVAPEPASEVDDIPMAAEMDADAVMDRVFHDEAPEGQATEASPAGDSPEEEMAVMMEEMTTAMVDSMRDTYAVLARRVELFQGVDPEDVAKIFSKGITAEYEADTVIFEKGQQGDELYVILGGEVLIHDGRRPLATLGRGDMFGEMALVSDEPRSACAKTTAQSSLLSLSLETINNVMPPDVSLRLLTNIVVVLSARLRQANSMLSAVSEDGPAGG
jgi:hypothetical protein